MAKVTKLSIAPTRGAHLFLRAEQQVDPRYFPHIATVFPAVPIFSFSPNLPTALLNNAQISAFFSLLSDLMKLHGEEDFRTKSYDFAARSIKNAPDEVAGMTLTELKSIKGIGDAIGQKIVELSRSGRMKMLDAYIEKTPEGLLQLIKVKGLGPAKLRQLWLELGIETPGELLYACHENRLLLLKGFGEKSQAQIRDQVAFQLQNAGKYRYHQLEEEASDLVDDLRGALGTELVSLTGEMRRAMPTLEGLEVLAEAESYGPAFEAGILQAPETRDGLLWARTSTGVPVCAHLCGEGFFGFELLRTTGNPAWTKALLGAQHNPVQWRGFDEATIFAQLGYPFVPPEYREWPGELPALSLRGKGMPELVTASDIKGIVHAHTTYSDGAATLRALAEYTMEEGFTYLVVTDHSRSAFYANGLSAERVAEQQAEIDRLNAEWAGKFRIFKGIESDILSDGSLDYEDSVLQRFEVVIASVHSNLRMDESKAMRRLLRAIENPRTHILGHPTGRLLLSRVGYPLDHRKLIDACAANRVAIELNANPHRLDLDWTWIPYAVSKGVLISINPDAHSLRGVHDLRYGILAARKGGLTAADCLNTLDAHQFANWATP
jgi:DNA polymerase (family 10)